MCKRKVLLFIKLALILVLCYVIIETILMPRNIGGGFKQKSVIDSENMTVSKPQSFTDTSIQDYSIIVEQNIFGCNALSFETNKSLHDINIESPAEPEEKRLDIELHGTVAGNPEISRAIIKDLGTNVLSLCKTGDTVATACIESIEKDTVVLLHQGQRKVLNLGTSGEPMQLDLDKSQVTLTKNITQTAESDPPAKPQTFVDKLRYMALMLPEAVIEPYAVNDKVEGLRVTGLENIEGAKDIGLKNGDVIRTVNGHRLTSKQKAYQISMKARSQTTLNIELLRKNKMKKFSLSLR